MNSGTYSTSPGTAGNGLTLLTPFWVDRIFGISASSSVEAECNLRKALSRSSSVTCSSTESESEPDSGSGSVDRLGDVGGVGKGRIERFDGLDWLERL